MERKALPASRRASAPGRPVSPLRRVTPEHRPAQDGVLLCMKRRSAVASRFAGLVAHGGFSSFGLLILRLLRQQVLRRRGVSRLRPEADEQGTLLRYQTE